MQLFKETNINFVGARFVALAVSAIVILVGVASIIFRGFSTSIDFTGGTELQYRFDQHLTEGELRDCLASHNLPAEVTSLTGDGEHDEWMVKLQTEEGHEQADVEAALNENFPNNPHELRSMNKIGPRVGEELRYDATWAVLWAMILVVIYITIRFEFMYAVGALLALIHDVLVTLGIFSVFGIEISLPIIAAVLTIVGYSLNDTIVVYDRIRENVKKMRGTGYKATVNASINQMLSRTMLTSLTTLMVVVVLFIFGGDSLHNMVFALMMGVIVGTYSSVFVAAPVLIEWHDRQIAKKK